MDEGSEGVLLSYSALQNTKKKNTMNSLREYVWMCERVSIAKRSD